jgi:hypothetical protein
MRVGGEQVVVKSAKTLVSYTPDTLFPDSVLIDAIDLGDRKFTIKGTVTAGAPINFWLNARTAACQIKWEHEGRSGWGEMIYVQGNDFLMNELSRTPSKS